MSMCARACVHVCMCACVHVRAFVRLCVLNVCAYEFIHEFVKLLHYCARAVWLDLHQNPHYAFSAYPHGY